MHLLFARNNEIVTKNYRANGFPPDDTSPDSRIPFVDLVSLLVILFFILYFFFFFF